MDKIKKTPRFIILTGVSGSGKTSIVNRLVGEMGMKQPQQFTTRKPRNDDELDTYCFLTEEQFKKKLDNGDFSEFTNYNGNWYGVSAYFDKSVTNIVILEPVGKEAMKKFLKLNGIPFITIYLNITPATMEDRLGGMRRESVKVIEERKKDFKYFSPEGYNYVVDANGSFEEVYRHVSHILKTNFVL